MNRPAHVIAQESYDRCLGAGEGFFATLYERLLASDPAVPPMFSDTEFPRQHRLLRHGIGLLLSFAKRGDEVLLERIAARHSAAGVDVPPSMYALFEESLIAAVRAHDPEFSDEVAAAWAEGVAPGIGYMKSRYTV